MSDIVGRLRDDQPGERQCVREARMDLGCLLMEAAAEIEKLRAALRGAEVWIDRWTAHVGGCSGKDESCECGRAFVLHDARAALGEKG